jgi:hypothetical protein
MLLYPFRARKLFRSLLWLKCPRLAHAYLCSGRVHLEPTTMDKDTRDDFTFAKLSDLKDLVTFRMFVPADCPLPVTILTTLRPVLN